MILLLLTSALALSFVPLTSNDLPVATVTAPSFAPATKKLTVHIATTTAPGAGDLDGHTFRVGIFTGETGGESLFSEVVTAAQLTTAGADITIDLVPYEKLVDLDKIYVDVLAKPTEGAEVSMLESGTRVAVSFAAKKATVTVAKVEATENVKISFTLTAALESGVANTKFVLGAKDDITVTEDDAASLKYSVTIPHADLLAAPLTMGYFKGEDAATSTLPISLFTVDPILTLAHKDVEKAEATFDNDPESPGKVYLKSGVADPELLTLTTKTCNIDYEKLASASIYYTDADGIMTSNKLDISLSTAPAAPTGSAYIAGASTADAPKVKLTFAAALTNRKLVMVNDPDDVIVDVSAEKPEVELSKFVGTAGYYIVLDDTTPKSLPSAAIDAAELTLAPAAKDDDGNIPVTVTITEIGYIAAVPAGLVVRVKGAADYTGAEYYPLVWSETEEKENEGTANIPLKDWKASKDKEIDAFVSPVYTTIPASPTQLSDVETVIGKLISTFVTVETVAFTPADLKLKVTIKSTADVSATAQGEYRIAGFDKAEEGNGLFEEAFTKAELSGGNKDVTATLVLGEAYADLKNIYVDVFETLTGKDEESMVKPERKKVTFAAKEAIAVEKTGTDLKFTITLDSDLATPLTDVKFVFNNVPKDVAAVTGETKKFTVTIPLADVRDAESKLGYVKGKDLATSTLPFSVVPPTPAPVLGLLSATHAKCVLADAPGGMKVMLKSGETAAKEMTKEEGEAFFRIAYADLKAECKVYYAIGADKFGEEATIAALAALVAPSAEALVAVADKLPSLKVTFGAAVEKRKLVLVQEEGEPVLVDVSAKDDTIITSDKLVGTDGYYIVTDEAGKVPKSEGKALAAATFTQTKAAVEDGKIPVTVEMTKGFYAAEPKGLLVHAKGEDDKTKMKFYPFTWDLTEANKASASVEVDDFKTITDKDIESYVCPDYSEAIPDEPVKISEAFVVIAKTEPVEPEPKDEGAFGQMVSLMAVVASLFVLAL